MALVQCYNLANIVYQTLNSPKVEIYTKSPFVIAGHTLSGTVSITLSNIVGISLTMIGTERGQEKHVFLKDTLVRESLDFQTRIPFDCMIPTMANGSCRYKRGSIKYYILCEVWYTRFSKVECLKVKKPIHVYSNRERWINQDQAISFITKDDYASIDFHIPQTIWLTNDSDITIHLAIQNNYSQHIKQVELKLLRKVGKRVETVSKSSSLKWWHPLAPNEKDDLVMTISSPPNEFSVDQQKEMNISFYIQAFIYYIQGSRKGICVANIPILLVHPISCSKISKTLGTSLSPSRPTLVPYTQQSIFEKMKQSFSSWIIDSSSTLSASSSCTTVRNVESYAAEKVEI